MHLNTFELRNYLIKPAMRDHFIDYFEAHFIFSQQAVNMHVLGQFRVVGAPDRFVWLRGFADIATRLTGLQAFYDGPIWQKYRERANAMIVDSHHVHLLRLLGSAADLTCGRTSDTVASELAAGTISPDTGMIAIGFYQTDPATMDSASVQLVESYRDAGIQVRGVFAAELSQNNFPRLPVIQNPGELVIITAYESEALYHQQVAPPVDPAVLSKGHDSLLLWPTLRSPLRW